MSTGPVTEIITITVKDNVSIDDARAQQTSAIAEHVGKQPGLRSVNWGFQLEEPRKNTWILNWESLDHHLTYTRSSTYPEFVAELQKYCTFGPLFHAKLTPLLPNISNGYTDIIERSNYIQMYTVPFKPEADKALWENQVFSLNDTSDFSRTPGQNGFQGLVKGKVVEDENKVVYIHGWDSAEAYQAFYASLDQAKIQSLRKPMQDALSGLSENVLIDLKNGSRTV